MSRDFKLNTLDEFLNKEFPKSEELFTGLLHSSKLVLAVAKPKSYKSTLLRDICISMSIGIDFNGKKIKRRNTAYIIGEEDPAEVQSHIFQILQNKKVETLDNFFIESFKGSLSPQEAAQFLKHIVTKYSLECIVIDPMVNLLNIEDLDSYNSSYALFEPISEVIRETQCSIVFITHANKSSDKAIGSIGFEAAADSIITINKDKNNSIIKVKTDGRHAPTQMELSVCSSTRTFTISKK